MAGFLRWACGMRVVCAWVSFPLLVSTVVRLVVSVASSVVFIPWRKCWGDSSSGMRWPGVFLRVFFLLLFRWIAWRLIRAEPISDIVFAVTAGILFMAFTPKLLSE